MNKSIHALKLSRFLPDIFHELFLRSKTSSTYKKFKNLIQKLNIPSKRPSLDFSQRRDIQSMWHNQGSPYVLSIFIDKKVGQPLEPVQSVTTVYSTPFWPFMSNTHSKPCHDNQTRICIVKWCRKDHAI